VLSHHRQLGRCGLCFLSPLLSVLLQTSPIVCTLIYGGLVSTGPMSYHTSHSTIPSRYKFNVSPETGHFFQPIFFHIFESDSKSKFKVLDSNSSNPLPSLHCFFFMSAVFLTTVLFCPKMAPLPTYSANHW
jgi:hypothetical protein